VKLLTLLDKKHKNFFSFAWRIFLKLGWIIKPVNDKSHIFHEGLYFSYWVEARESRLVYGIDQCLL